jgi:Bardet-Biedl syndrome 9 protein
MPDHGALSDWDSTSIDKMSVFGVKDWWSTQPSNNEEFDVKSLTALLPNKIVLASLQGVVRIYSPASGGYKIEHLELEAQLDPILQVSAGMFAHMPTQTLAVLHPRSMGVYTILNSSLKLCYEHKLQRNAFNFTFGAFGSYNGQGRHFICIQSSDGALGFYEHEVYVFAVQLPGFLTPGPITYNSVNDTFLVCNSNMQIECYRYNKFREAFSKYKQGQEVTFTPDWKFNLGEYAQDIQVSKAPGMNDIYTLGEHSLFIMSDSGVIKLQKKLDYTPSCMCLFTDSSVIIGSFSGHLLIYRHNRLEWAAKLSESPVGLLVMNLEVEGMLVSLSENGYLEVGYLGTSPLPYSMISQPKTQDYEAMDKEYRAIMNELANTAVATEPIDKFIIGVQVPECPSHDPHLIENYASDEEGTIVMSVRMLMRYSGDRASDVCITIFTPANIECRESPIYYENIQGATPLNQSLTFVTRPNYPAYSLWSKVTISYTVSGVPRVATNEIRLPIFQVAKYVPPIKEETYHIILTMAQPVPALETLFPELQLVSPNALSFQFYDGSFATLIIGKSGERVKIQGSHFEALWLAAEEIAKRVGTEVIKYDQPLPLQDYFSLIDDHFACRDAIRAEEERLKQVCEQYTAIEKRLLVRFKDRNPTDLNNLDYLLSITHQEASRLADRIEALQMEERFASYKLSAATGLICLLIKSRFGIDEQGYKVLTQHLTSHVAEGDPGWQETTNVAMTHLLRTVLSKNARESSASIGTLNFPSSTEKLKKHITIVCDRLAKGGKLI